MPPRGEPTSEELRLAVKRAFSRYYLELCSRGIADPTDAYEACAAYLTARLIDRGYERYRDEIEEDAESIAGEVEQDLRRRYPHIRTCLAEESLDDRFEECFTRGWERASRSRC